MSRDQVAEKAVSCLLLAELEWSSEAEASSLQPVCSRCVCSTQPDAGASTVTESSRGHGQASHGLFKGCIAGGKSDQRVTLQGL